jgi:hypothetical protein
VFLPLVLPYARCVGRLPWRHGFDGKALDVGLCSFGTLQPGEGLALWPFVTEMYIPLFTLPMPRITTEAIAPSATRCAHVPVGRLASGCSGLFKQLHMRCEFLVGTPRCAGSSDNPTCAVSA